MASQRTFNLRHKTAMPMMKGEIYITTQYWQRSRLQWGKSNEPRLVAIIK
jgi:hypothetical protein